MNQQERDELRAKHRLVDYRDGADHPKCGYCNLGEWPCDTIRVLDWAESQNYPESDIDLPDYMDMDLPFITKEVKP